MHNDELRIAIIGAGPGALCTAKRLFDEGFTNFTIFEQADGVGGTWRRNTYPGCECDIPSALYSFSFEFKADWSKPYGKQPEILAYMETVAAKYGILPRCRFKTAVVSAHWVDADSIWTLILASGEQVEAEVVVSALGMFNELAWPSIPGLESFQGAMWHSAQWNHDYDLAGKRVAVIGSAASAVQLVPEIVQTAAQVHLFQRTPNWVLPKIDDPYTEDQLEAFRNDPAPLLAMRAIVEESINSGISFSDPKMIAEREAAGLANIAHVNDPALRDQLRPTHPFGCKRPLFSNAYYPAFNRTNLELVTDPIDRIDAHGITNVDGTHRPVDAIVIATGFATTKYLSAIEVVGREGSRLADAWADGPIAHLGITTTGFPNLYMLYGPNTNNGSIITMLEYQVEHVMEHLRWIVTDNLRSVEVTSEAMAVSNTSLQEGIAAVPAWQAACNGYYRSPSGRVVTQWPHSMIEFGNRTKRVVQSDYLAVQR